MALTEEQLAFVRETALTPLGQNVAPAIVTCIIYFLYLGPAIYSFLSTSMHYLISSFLPSIKVFRFSEVSGSVAKSDSYLPTQYLNQQLKELIQKN